MGQTCRDIDPAQQALALVPDGPLRDTSTAGESDLDLDHWTRPVLTTRPASSIRLGWWLRSGM